MMSDAVELSDYQIYKNKYADLLEASGPIAAAQYICATEAPDMNDPDTFFLDILKDAIEAMAHGEMQSDFMIAFTLVRVMCQSMPISLDKDLIAKAIAVLLGYFNDFHLNQLKLMITPVIAQESPVKEALHLAKLLETCRFSAFWEAYHASDHHFKSGVNVGEVRETIARVMTVAYSTFVPATAVKLLGNPSQDELDRLAESLHWEILTVEGKKVYSVLKASDNLVKLVGLDGQDIPSDNSSGGPSIEDIKNHFNYLSTDTRQRKDQKIV
eukprot:GHVH01004959.1.p2 GENE.GHVH01004959.1~~GHVH01004959.1.p2  ORF type:complete len:270 (-),score=54.07 GHVH01004959.1:1763-2572(-)